MANILSLKLGLREQNKSGLKHTKLFSEKSLLTFGCVYRVVSWNRALIHDIYNIHYKTLIISNLKIGSIFIKLDIVKVKIMSI